MEYDVEKFWANELVKIDEVEITKFAFGDFTKHFLLEIGLPSNSKYLNDLPLNPTFLFRNFKTITYNGINYICIGYIDPYVKFGFSEKAYILIKHSGDELFIFWGEDNEIPIMFLNSNTENLLLFFQIDIMNSVKTKRLSKRMDSLIKIQKSQSSDVRSKIQLVDSCIYKTIEKMKTELTKIDDRAMGVTQIDPMPFWVSYITEVSI